MFVSLPRVFLAGLASMCFSTSISFADEPAKLADDAAAKTPTQEELIKSLEAKLTGAKLTGRFTVTGKEDSRCGPVRAASSSTSGILPV